MIDVVVDASVILRWAFDDVRDRAGAVATERALREARIIAIEPPLFLLEIASALLKAARDGRIDESRAAEVLGALERVELEPIAPHAFALACLRLALETGLRVADASYLEVARRRGAVLVTADEQLAGAALRIGVSVVTLAEVPPW